MVPSVLQGRFAALGTLARTLGFGLCILLTTVVGCGGDQDDTGDTTPTPHAPPSPTATPANHARFWLAGWGVSRSDDGGETWNHLPVDASDVHFVDRDNGWAVDGGDIFRTTDGGESWVSQSDNIDRRDAVTALGSVSFLNEREGMALGHGPHPQLFELTPVIVSTNDGGAHWRVANIDAGGDLVLEDASCQVGCFAGSGRGFACCGHLFGFTCLVSDDRGATWQKIPDPTYARSATCVGQNDVWTLRGGTRLSRSTDSGATWSDRSVGIPTDLSVESTHFHSITFVDEMTGWIGGSTAVPGVGGRPIVLHTTDGGATWTQQTLPDTGPFSGIHLIHFVDARTGLAVGLEHTEMLTFIAVGWATSDGGQTWRKVPIPIANTLFDLAGVP